VDTPLVVVIDRDSPDAAYEQVAAQVRSAIATGRLRAGTTLPGVRTLASDLGVNLNTIARAYRRLEEQGFVRIRDRSGVEVATPARQASPETREELEQELWALLVRMRQAGVSPSDLRQITARQFGLLERA
jgi:DNA-binding transcriptional regulator YhcF (GntR family)